MSLLDQFPQKNVYFFTIFLLPVFVNIKMFYEQDQVVSLFHVVLFNFINRASFLVLPGETIYKTPIADPSSSSVEH